MGPVYSKNIDLEQQLEDIVHQHMMEYIQIAVIPF